MAISFQTESSRRLADRFLAPGSSFQRYRWLVWVAASAVVVALVIIVRAQGSVLHPLDPVGAAIVFVSVLAAGLSGPVVGAGTALVGVIASFSLLADFSNLAAATNAFVSGALWCFAAVVTGLTVKYFRTHLLRREAALQQALGRSLSVRRNLERVLDFAPQFHLEGDLATIGHAICKTATQMFGADGATLYSCTGDTLRLLAVAPPAGHLRPGLEFTLSECPDLAEVLTGRRPSYLRNVPALVASGSLSGPVLAIPETMHTVSCVRMPIVGATGVVGLMVLSWSHAIGHPSEELLALMQRFADQAAVAWQNALQVEAQKQADELRRTLDKVLALAPSFHITDNREKVAEAICEAALATFSCGGAALYRVEGERLRMLARRVSPGKATPEYEAASQWTLPLPGSSRDLLAEPGQSPLFVKDLSAGGNLAFPWPQEVARELGAASALFVPLRFNILGPRNLLVLAWDSPQSNIEESFLAVVQRFADQAALALTNASAAQLHARLEASLLPALPTVHPELGLLTRYRAGEQRLRLGGDFVGATVSPDGVVNFVIGDVSGHGPDAAALGATLRSTWRALTLAEIDLVQTVSLMDAVLRSEPAGRDMFATLIVGKLDPKGHTLTLVNAGHPPPLLLTPNEVIALESPAVLPLGFAEPSQYIPRDFSLPEAWTLVCYTDGILDAHLSANSSERFGEERLKASLRTWPVPGLEENLLDNLLNNIEAGNGGPFADDVALLVIYTKSLLSEAAASVDTPATINDRESGEKTETRH